MKAICLVIDSYLLFLFARLLLSWYPFNPAGKMATVTGFVYMVTDHVIQPLRRKLPPVGFGQVAFDLSSMIALLILLLLRQVFGC